MKRITIIATLLGSFSLNAGPFASPAEDSAQIIMAQTKSASLLFPMRLVAVNGNNISSRSHAVWMKPGEYELKFSATVDRGLTKAPTIRPSHQKAGSTLDLKLEANKVYYVAYDASSADESEWQPVVYSIKTKGQ